MKYLIHKKKIYRKIKIFCAIEYKLMTENITPNITQPLNGTQNTPLQNTTPTPTPTPVIPNNEAKKEEQPVQKKEEKKEEKKDGWTPLQLEVIDSLTNVPENEIKAYYIIQKAAEREKSIERKRKRND